MSGIHEIPWHRARFAAVLGLTTLLLLAPGSMGASPVGAAAPPSAAAPTVPAAAGGQAPAARWVWPLDPVPRVARPFDGPPAPWLPGHRGVDLRAESGQAVLAPARGRVAFAGTVVDRGVVTIEHGGGLRTSYEPVTTTLAVGTVVARGQVVAVVAGGPGHCPPRSCLHWGLRRGDVYLDPLLLVRTPKPPVLLPWQGPVAKGMSAFRPTTLTNSPRAPSTDGRSCGTRLLGD